MSTETQYIVSATVTALAIVGYIVSAALVIHAMWQRHKRERTEPKKETTS